MATRTHPLDISRRRLLRGAPFALGAALAATAAAAENKVSQKLARYQATPKGDQRCDNCVQWQPPASCKIVAGEISPAGWCILYARAPKP
jgi:hypothetical protein